MNTVRVFSSAVALIASLVALTATGKGLVFGNVSSWTIFTDPAEAYRCSAEVAYEAGTAIRLGHDSPGSGLYLSIADPSLADIDRGRPHDASLSFDDSITFELRGTGDGDGIKLSIPAAAQDSFLKEFTARHVMTVSIGGAKGIDLSLAGSLRATRMLGQCQTSMSRHAAGSD